jgi:hypothetical protein
VKRQDAVPVSFPFNGEFTLTVRVTGRETVVVVLFCNVTLNTVLPRCVSGMVTLVLPVTSPVLAVTVTVLPPDGTAPQLFLPGSTGRRNVGQLGSVHVAAVR